MAKRMMMALSEETKFKIQQLRLDMKVKTEDDVVKFLLNFYEQNGDPLVFEAMELIRKIRGNN